MQHDIIFKQTWISAIREDCTFLIFNCGRYERIGIRDRSSQTLYLSDLIDTACTPDYGRMHLGVHLAIIEDVYARHDAKKKYHAEWARAMEKSASYFSDSSSHRKQPRRTDSTEPPYTFANGGELYEVAEVSRLRFAAQPDIKIHARRSKKRQPTDQSSF